MKEFRKFLKYYPSLKPEDHISIPFMEDLSRTKKNPSNFCNDHLGDQAVLHFDGNIYGCPLAPCFNDHYREFLLFGTDCQNIDCKRLLPMRQFNVFKQFGLKTDYNHPYINELGRMLCLCFNQDGALISVDGIKNNMSLSLQMYKEAKEAA